MTSGEADFLGSKGVQELLALTNRNSSVGMRRFAKCLAKQRRQATQWIYGTSSPFLRVSRP